MKLLELFIKKEALSIAIALLIVVFGIFAIYHMPIRLFPKVTEPVITIKTTYPGANQDVVKGFITSRLENALTGLAHINFITASSTKSVSTIQVHFKPNTNTNEAMVKIMEKTNEQRSYLPNDVKGPIVNLESDDDSPAMIVAFTSHHMARVQVAEYLRRVIQPELEVITGVSSAGVMGRQYAMRLNLNPELLSAYGVTATDVLRALNQQNILSQTGNLEGRVTNMNISASSNFSTPEAFNNLIIQQKNDNVIRLKDVGQAKFTAEDDKINAFYNGQPSTMLFVKLVSGANPLTVSASIKSVLAKINQHLPYDMKGKVVFNVANYIHSSIIEVVHSLLIAFGIILLVLIVFLGSFRAMIIPLVTIPISLIGGIFMMGLIGYSLNTLTLLAMVLAIGLVVDDAIVVVENIFRHLHQTKSRMLAAQKGTNEVFSAIIAMTLTLAAVFAPIFFMGGVTGSLFSEFAFALIASVLISGFIALSLTPMMCSRLLSISLEESLMAKASNNMMLFLEKIYHTALNFIFNKKAIAVIVWAITILGCGYLYHSASHELAPTEDIGFLMAMGAGPATANQHYVLQYKDQINKSLTTPPAVKDTIIIQGIPSLNQFLAFPILHQWGKRNQTTMQVQPIIQRSLNKIPGLKSYVMVPSSLPGSSGAQFQFVITSSSDYKYLYSAAKQFEKKAMSSGIFSYLNDDLNRYSPNLALEINRNDMSALHIDMNSVSDSLALLTGNIASQQFNYFGHSYDVILSSDKHFLQDPQQLNLISVRNTEGNLVPLSNLITPRVHVQPSSLNEFQKQNAVTITGVIAPHHSISEAITYTQKMAPHTLPTAMNYDYSGATRQYIEEGSRFLQIFSLSVVIIFLILGIQFNSFRDSLLILIGSVPMALFAALIPLKFGFGSINIYTQIALLTLVGLIAKHGVLMTKFANELKKQGVDKITAIKEAAKVRFRPILMTTVAMTFGALPLVFASGAGSVSRFQMGLTIVAGLSIGTLCTLFVFPVLYQLFSKKYFSDP